MPVQKHAYVVVQEGGSSQERFVNVYNKLKGANNFRTSCHAAAYRTSEPIRIPAALADAEGFMEFAQELAAASVF